jgi:hypothetical protein
MKYSYGHQVDGNKYQNLDDLNTVKNTDCYSLAKLRFQLGISTKMF